MIRIEGLSRTYRRKGKPSVDALSGLDLTIETGETLALLGPSGCGKTTTLRLLNRLLEPTAGRVLIDGQDTAALDPVMLRRRMGYVVQRGGLFPHLTVRRNIAILCEIERWDRGKLDARVDELLTLVGLEPAAFRDRYPAELSGGQRQRVGVARALALDPPILLMDEPFGALDPITRDRLQNEFLRLHEVERKTVIFVTHDIDEAIKLGDRIAILREGGILAQYDTPDAILAAPADDFVARFVGADRGLKRLALRRLSEIDLDPPNGVPDDLPRARLETTLRDALSLMLTEGVESLVVIGDDGEALGGLSLGRVSRLLAEP
jgi:osmoprotectant transport system ATP-binding protein